MADASDLCSFSDCYMAAMVRLALLVTLTLAACVVRPDTPPPVPAAGRTGVSDASLQGRWTISSVNGRKVDGLWLELGGEGLGTVTKTERGIFAASPQPRTRAHLGCNDWHPNGWTRQEDKLTLGVEMSHRTERGCDAAREALDDEAYAILRKPMAMYFVSSNRVRLMNENGTLEIVWP